MITSDVFDTEKKGRIKRLTDVYHRVTDTLERSLDGWFLELAARLVFAASLLVYYLNSVLTKLGDGLFGILSPSAGAFAQIVPPIAEEYMYDTSAIPFFPWHVIVISGSIAELILPIFLVLGLFTRLSALAMIGFVVVQTLVDIMFHSVAAGALFDHQANGLLDQRLFWIFPLLLLVIKGGGKLSMDTLWHYWLNRRHQWRGA